MDLIEIKKVILNNDYDEIIQSIELESEKERISIIFKERVCIKNYEEALNTLCTLCIFKENEYEEFCINGVNFEVINYFNRIVELEVSYKEKNIEDVKDYIIGYLHDEMMLCDLVDRLSYNGIIDYERFDYDVALKQGGWKFNIKDNKGNYIDEIYLDVDFEVVKEVDEIENTEIRITYIAVE